MGLREFPVSSHYPPTLNNAISSQLAVFLPSYSVAQTPIFFTLTKDFSGALHAFLALLRELRKIRERLYVRITSAKLTSHFVSFLYLDFCNHSHSLLFSLKLFRLPKAAADICSCSSQLDTFISILANGLCQFFCYSGLFCLSVHWFQHIESSEFSSHLRCSDFHSQSLKSHPAFTFGLDILTEKNTQSINLMLGIILSFC